MYLQLNCVMRKYHKHAIPITFLIDESKKAKPSVAYVTETKEVLGGQKFTGLRPLRDLAYSFSSLQAQDGHQIITERAKNGEEAGEFVKTILKWAEPIEEEQFRRELESLRWPTKESEKPGFVSRKRVGGAEDALIWPARKKRKKKSELFEELLMRAKDMKPEKLQFLVEIAKVISDEK